MPKIYIARRSFRRALHLPMGATKKNPSLLFPLDGTASSEIDELVRAMLAKQRITAEPQIQAIARAAEEQFEHRIKIWETRKELKRLMGLRQAGARLMQVGFRKWKQAFYRPRASNG